MPTVRLSESSHADSSHAAAAAAASPAPPSVYDDTSRGLSTLPHTSAHLACGAGVDGSGYLTESCVLNVLVVGPDRVVRTPPFEGILRGTTARRVLELAQQRNQLSAAVAGVEQRPISLEEARAACELILVAGDTHVFACTSLDGQPIGDGRPGPVKEAIRAVLEQDAAEGEEDHEPL